MLSGAARYRLMQLSFGPQEKLSLHIGIFPPSGNGPHSHSAKRNPSECTGAAATANGTESGQRTKCARARRARTWCNSSAGSHGTDCPAAAERHASVLRRGYALVVFNPNDCAEDTTLRNSDGSWAFRSTRFYPTYPGYAWGILAGWAWGDSRVADDLEKNPLIDKARLIITGGLLPRSMANHAAGLWRNSLYRIRCPRATRLTLLPAERMSRSTAVRPR